ncbi:hypothetical protein [Legionella sp.]
MLDKAYQNQGVGKLLVEKVKQKASGFRNFENYRVRVKVLCG